MAMIGEILVEKDYVTQQQIERFKRRNRNK